MNTGELFDYLIAELERNPGDFCTVPLKKKDGVWFYAYAKDGNIYIGPSKNKLPSSTVQPCMLKRKEFDGIYRLFLKRKEGEIVSKDAQNITRYQVYWYGLINELLKEFYNEGNKDMSKFEWIEIYKELAHKLRDYKSKRDELIKIIKNIFIEIKIDLPTLEKDNEIVDIDPFTVYGLFNKSSMKNENRIMILSKLTEKFNLKSIVPHTFDGVPVVNNMNATFYYFIDGRNDSDIDNLWELFIAALDYAENDSLENKERFSEYFTKCLNAKGIGKSKLTMALFWINPCAYLNLDQRNEWYIYDSDRMPKSLVNRLPLKEYKILPDTYFNIMNIVRQFFASKEIPFKNFAELSYEAWRYSEEVNRSKKDEKDKINFEENVHEQKYWLYSPGDNASKWDEYKENGIIGIGWGKIGSLENFSSKDEIKNEMQKVYPERDNGKNDLLAIWQFANEMQEGDIIFVKKGLHKLIGKGVIVSNYIYDDTSEDDFTNIRKVEWIYSGELDYQKQFPIKALTEITNNKELIKSLEDLINNDKASTINLSNSEKYEKKQFLDDVYMDENEYDILTNVLRNKRNIILQGSPGVGKTYIAKRLAYSMIGEKDEKRVKMVQFHQSYSYEDFVMGYRPTENGFELKKGVFYKLCKDALNDKTHDYFFIIDEINRGNLSKIFGELFMLIENDKRGMQIQLMYNDEEFTVPDNIFIIGMMNTADRSLAILDYALRRRFAFFDIKPCFENHKFKKYQQSLNSKEFDNLILCVKELNSAILNDDALGEGFCIGHSYFCNMKSDSISKAELNSIVEYELIPLIKEYWFDENSKIREWSMKLRSAVK